MADKLWHQIYVTTFLAQSIVWYTTIVTSTTYFWMTWYYWPQEYYFPYGIYACLCFCVWIYYSCPHTLSFAFIFSQICYYLSLKLDDCNRKLKLYATTKPQNLDLMEIIGEHNEICKEIALFNKFWNFNLLIDAIIYSSLLAFLLFISFFTNIVDFLKLIFPPFSLFIFICFFAIYGIASIISSKVNILNVLILLKSIILILILFWQKWKAHKSYALLNSISIKSTHMPLGMKLQLNDYISRLGGPVIGFYCLDICPITKKTIYDVIKIFLQSYPNQKF
jgi:hypothetical protein